MMVCEMPGSSSGFLFTAISRTLHASPDGRKKMIGELMTPITLPALGHRRPFQTMRVSETAFPECCAVPAEPAAACAAEDTNHRWLSSAHRSGAGHLPRSGSATGSHAAVVIPSWYEAFNCIGDCTTPLPTLGSGRWREEAKLG